MALVGQMIEIEFLTRLGLAALLGALIGFEREIHDQPAGLRTHTLVCIGSALFTMSALEFTGPNIDPTRIISNIVVGVGFIGAGAIFKAENRVSGASTAADLWVLGAVGLLVGLGAYLNAIIAGLGVWLILVLGHKLKKKVVKTKESDT